MRTPKFKPGDRVRVTVDDETGTATVLDHQGDDMYSLDDDDVGLCEAQEQYMELLK